MKVDAGIGTKLRDIPEQAKQLEKKGYDGLRTAEMNHDPFFPLLLAAEHTQTVEIATSIAVAFARSPMNLANIGHDLNAYSKGFYAWAWLANKAAHYKTLQHAVGIPSLSNARANSRYESNMGELV